MKVYSISGGRAYCGIYGVRSNECPEWVGIGSQLMFNVFLQVDNHMTISGSPYMGVANSMALVWICHWFVSLLKFCPFHTHTSNKLVHVAGVCAVENTDYCLSGICDCIAGMCCLLLCRQFQEKSMTSLTSK